MKRVERKPVACGVIVIFPEIMYDSSLTSSGMEMVSLLVLRGVRWLLVVLVLIDTVIQSRESKKGCYVQIFRGDFWPTMYLDEPFVDHVDHL